MLLEYRIAGRETRATKSLADGFEIRYNGNGSVTCRFEWMSKSDAGHEVPSTKS